MGEIYYYSEEIDYLLEDYRRILRELQNDATEEKIYKSSHDISTINEKVKIAKDAYFIEIKNMPEKEQISLIGKIKGKMSILENLNMEYDFVKSKFLYDYKDKTNKEQTREQILTTKEAEIRGDAIQDKTQESINRMKKLVNESEHITKSAAEKLADQNLKLMEVTDKVDDVEINVAHAKNTIREIAKGALADRFIRLLMLMVFIALIILIILIAIPRQRSNR